MQEELLILMAIIMVGCAYTSYRIGTKEGIGMAIDYFHHEGIIAIDEE
jgi:hypothetical protein